jgi:hypothetical protein
LNDFTDQYGFKRGLSTNHALIKLHYEISKILENIPTVRCFAFDFSRAFDSVNHKILIDCMSSYPIPIKALQWVTNFLTGRSQMTKFNGIVSENKCINRSIVQGSVMGPTCFLYLISKLQPLSQNLVYIKYADDRTVIVNQI